MNGRPISGILFARLTGFDPRPARLDTSGKLDSKRPGCRTSGRFAMVRSVLPPFYTSLPSGQRGECGSTPSATPPAIQFPRPAVIGQVASSRPITREHRGMRSAAYWPVRLSVSNWLEYRPTPTGRSRGCFAASLRPLSPSEHIPAIKDRI